MEIPDRKKAWKPETWYKESMKEYSKYQKTKEPEKLAQAGEKMWNSYTLLLDKRTGIKHRNFKQIKESMLKDPQMKNIFDDAYWMHIFFYRGFTEDITMEEGKFRNLAKSLQKVM